MSLPAPTTTVKRLLPWLVAVAFFMESLDATILNTAVPTIAAALHVAPLSMKSALTSYMLSLAVFIPISGWVADRFGSRKVFSSAIGLFMLGSFLCGISTRMSFLVAARILQGCGGAMMVPVGRLTLVRTFAKSELVRAISFFSVPALIGPMLGPLAGGLIVSYFHWRIIFCVTLPVDCLGLYLVNRFMPNYRTERIDPLDFIGLILFGSGIALFSCVLEIFGEHTLGPTEIISFLALSFLLLFAYWRHSLTLPRPLLRLGLFRIRTFRSSVIGGLVTRLGVGGVPFLLPLLYQIGLGYTPVQSGLLIMPQPLAAMSLKMAMPRIITRFGYRRVLVSNTIMIGLSIAIFSTIGAGTPVWLIAVQAFRSDGHAENHHPLRLPPGARIQHDHDRALHRDLLYHRCRHACLANRCPGLRLRLFLLPPVHRNQHDCLRRPLRRGYQHGQQHRQHHAAALPELRRRRRLPHHRFLHPRPLPRQPLPDDLRRPPRPPNPGRHDTALHARLPRDPSPRRSQREPALGGMT